MSAINIIKAYAKKQLTKNRGSGIMELPSDMVAESRAGEIAATLQNAGMPLQQLDDFIRSEKDLVKFLNIIESTSKPKVLSGDEAAKFLNKAFPPKGKLIPFPQKRSFAEEIEAMKKSGDIVDPDNLKKSDKVRDREMFKEANERFKKNETEAEILERLNRENKEAAERIREKSMAKAFSEQDDKEMDQAIFNLTERQGISGDSKVDAEFLAEELAALRGISYDDMPTKERLGLYGQAYDRLQLDKFKNKKPKDDDPGFYTGGIVDVEPSLSDIGHGADALMSRTRLVSPGSQATTSTGLNYLLAEDNDNLRVPFSGGGMGRRAFLKLMAALTGGVAAAKSGILSLGGKEAAKEVVKKSGGTSEVPPYFFRLVEKIRFMGDETLASQDKAIAKKYKDYLMEEDFAGNITIIKKGEDLQGNKLEDVYMNYKVDDVATKDKKGFARAEEYEEFTAYPDMEGKMKDVEPGVPDEVVQEAGDIDAMTLKKAEGGRIGYATKGKVDLADLESLQGIKSSDSDEKGRFATNPARQQARGIAALGFQGAAAGKKQKEDIKNKVIGAFTYVVDNLDQETASYVKSLFNDKLQLGYSTTMSGLKQDAFSKTGIVPIDSETIYNAIINLDLPNDVKLKMSAISDRAGDEEIKASLKSNNLGITYDSDKQEIVAQYTNVLAPDGSLRITPIVAKDEDSNIIKDLQIDKAFETGDLKFSLNESDILNKKNIATKYDGENISFFADKTQDDFGNTLATGLTAELPVYLLNEKEKPSVSFNLEKDLNSGFETKMLSGNFPITDNLSLFGSRKEDDSGRMNDTNYGLEYNFEKPIGDRGSLFTKANIDNKGDYGINFGFSIPFGQEERKAPSYNFSTNDPEEAYELYKKTDGFRTVPRSDKERMLPLTFAKGGGVKDLLGE